MQIALMGCGPRGQRLAEIALHLGHTIDVCADARAALAEDTAARLQARAATSPLDGLNGVQAVFVSDPSESYVAPALRAMRSGIHVYWNAPLTTDPKTARSLLDAAKTSGAALGSAYPNRHCPQYAAAATHAGTGPVGKIGFIRVHRRATHSENGALDALAGDLDFIAATFGPVETVYAQFVQSSPVDSALLTLTTGRGPIVQCACSVAPNNGDSARASIELCGRSGMIQFDTHTPILSIRTSATKSTSGHVDSSPLNPSAAERRLSAFFATAAKAKMPMSQLRHEIHMVRIVEAALDSARTGRAIKVKR